MSLIAINFTEIILAQFLGRTLLSEGKKQGEFTLVSGNKRMSSPPAKVGKLPPFGGELQRQLHFGGPVKVGIVERAIKTVFKF